MLSGLRLTAKPAERAGALLPENVQGAFWVIASCLLVVSMSVVVKMLGARLDSFQLSFFRAAFGLLVVAPFALAAGPTILRTRRLGLHLARGIAGGIGMISGFYALTHLPLADVSAIGFTKPLFLIVLATLVLRERVGYRRWSATFVGFLGVLIMVRPGGGVLELAALVALLGALAAACVKLFVKQLSQTERPVTILVYLGLITTTLTALPAYLVWQPPTVIELALMLLVGVLASLAQLCIIRGYKIGEASALAPFEYSRLPFAATYGILLFAEIPDLYTLAGAALIVASTLYIAHREAQLGKQLTVQRASAEA